MHIATFPKANASESLVCSDYRDPFYVVGVWINASMDVEQNQLHAALLMHSNVRKFLSETTWKLLRRKLPTLICQFTEKKRIFILIHVDYNGGMLWKFQMSLSSNSRDDSKQSELRCIDFRLFTISEHVFISFLWTVNIVVVSGPSDRQHRNRSRQQHLCPITQSTSASIPILSSSRLKHPFIFRKLKLI